MKFLIDTEQKLWCYKEGTINKPFTIFIIQSVF